MRFAICIVIAVAASSAAFSERRVPAATKPYGIEPLPQFAHMSSASCSAAACHGGGQPGKPGSEHSTWAPQVFPQGDHDPHSRAYRALFNEDSVRIASLLGGGPAHDNVLCLKCHAPAGVSDRTARAEGVGCTACHGPADKWIIEHYLPSWKAKSNHEKWSQTGFIPTKNLVARISACASCHVGSADREVNHDLIAAGHPRLAFEYTSFHFRPGYRKHWEERLPQPEFEVQAWVIGQAANLRAAVDLVHARAGRAKENKTPWSEFAGYNCFSCHQAIGKDESKVNSSTGRPGWEVWYTAAVGIAASDSRKLAAAHKLKELMDRSAAPAIIEPQAAKARDELDRWLAELQAAEVLPRQPANPQRILRALAEHSAKSSEWDALAAGYLGCAAMTHAAGSQSKVTQDLDSLHSVLEFPRIASGRYNNPVQFDRGRLEQARSLFLKVRDAAGDEK